MGVGEGLAVDVFAVADIKDDDKELLVLDLVDDPVAGKTKFPFSLKLTFERFPKVWVLSKTADSFGSLVLIFLGQFLEVFQRSVGVLDGVHGVTLQGLAHA